MFSLELRLFALFFCNWIGPLSTTAHLHLGMT